jgi:hypothetical protein
MGTNYFYTYDRCECCGRGEQIHMCKNLTSWHAYLGHGEEVGELNGEVKSWKDWKRALAQPDVCVTDEYGDFFSPEEFIEKVENVSRLTRSKHYLERLQYTGINWSGPETFWQDLDGFLFQTVDFR